MQMYELDQIIEETSAHHWEKIEGGPTFLHSYMVTGGFDESHISAVEYHQMLAVLRADVDVRIAWGYDPDYTSATASFSTSTPSPTRRSVSSWATCSTGGRWCSGTG